MVSIPIHSPRGKRCKYTVASVLMYPSGASPMFAQGLAKSEIKPIRVNGVSGNPSTSSRISLIHTRRCAHVPTAPQIFRILHLGSVPSENFCTSGNSLGAGTLQLGGLQTFPGEF